MPRPAMFEAGLLPERRDRAHAAGFADGADFLHRSVAESMADRLATVTRVFKDCAVIGAGSGAVRKALPPGVDTTWVELSATRAAFVDTVPVATLDPLPLATESCDLLFNCLELHWANDPVGQLIQMRRALRPDGLMIAALFGGQTLVELRSALAEAEAALTGGLRPRVAPMGELRDLGGLLQRAGFALPVADSERIEVTYADIWALMRDLRAMGETSILADRPRGFTRRALFETADSVYREAFPADDGRIRASFEIVYLTGWAPAESQPKPLRPGSASMRLADALGTTEIGTGEKAGPDTPTTPGPKRRS